MKLDEIINKRYSVRKFKQDPISDKDIKAIIETGRLAPTGNNAQPQMYYIVKSKEMINKLKENNVFKQDFVYDAPVIIFCAGNPDAYPSMEGSNEVRAVRDVSIASAFMVLKATELGIGSCYIGWLEKEPAMEILGIPKDYVLPYAIALGYSDTTQHQFKRKPLDEYYIEI